MKPRLEIGFPLRQQKCFLFGEPYNSGQRVFQLNHNRSGILLALQTLRLPVNSGVGVMAYNCHTVMEAVVQAKLKPVFIDITDELMIDYDDLDRKLPHISVLIVTHLFGIVNDVKHIREEFPHLIIIEDCAHAYGIENVYGDFAVFSIGQGKLPSIGDGGLLLVNNLCYLEQLMTLYNALPDYSLLQSVKLFFSMLIRSWMYSRCAYGWLTLPVKRKRSAALNNGDFKPMKMCRGVSAIYAIEKGKVADKIKYRERNAEQIMDSIRTSGEMESILGINAFMLVVKCQSPDVLREKLKGIGLDSATHFVNAIHWAKEFGYQSGECPTTELLINHLLMIPTY